MESKDSLADFSKCCIDTFNKHSAINPMMVCQTCKNLIKCFDDDKAYNNYITFCKSRKRKLILGKTSDIYLVAFSGFSDPL